ncbi:DegV family protein [Caryophanon tenue]|uniref:Fatty acid-binding protein DegV n=1 Tax=Caryophanon tenue TaxID=33978 RepID=A0A1C0YE19_9BACL|nr:DegV family protein [Caryophanon tenue]OCS85432.1 fatty acid-binding protein DegV [Caryophanon tenue]
MKLYTDSACDLPLTYLEAHDITLFPLRVEYNGQDLADRVEITPQQIFDILEQGGQPKTSQVSPETFLAAFTEQAKAGEEGVYIAFSSGLSGTFATAVMMREQVKETYPDFSLHIIDTKCASFGQGFVVKEAVRLREAGVTATALAEQLTAYAASIQHVFAVDDLDHLARGGRLSKSTAFVGGLLNIKPILTITDEGLIDTLDKARGKKRAFKQVVEHVKARGGDFTSKTIGIAYTGDVAIVDELKAVLTAELQPKDFDVTTIGAVIGSHVGLGVFALFFEK